MIHNHEVPGSIPGLATENERLTRDCKPFLFLMHILLPLINQQLKSRELNKEKLALVFIYSVRVNRLFVPRTKYSSHPKRGYFLNQDIISKIVNMIQDYPPKDFHIIDKDINE